MKNKDQLFDSGEIFSATNEELDSALKELSTGHVPNDTVRHREIIRGITINTIKSQRHIDRIESRNRTLMVIIIILSVATIVSNFIN